jgi:hypothetical protein
MPVPPWLEREAKQAVDMCPTLALRLAPAAHEQAMAALPAAAGRRELAAETRTDLIVSESWIADLTDASGRIPRQLG